MLIISTTQFSFRPALALVVALCLLFAGQAAHPYSVDSDVPRISTQDVREGVSLSGQWRFKVGDNLAWASPQLNDSAWPPKGVPERWPTGGYPESDQVAWYRLTLQLDPESIADTGLLGMRLGKVLSAYELYAGGQLLGGAGSLPPLSEVNYDRQQVLSIPASAIAEDGRLVLALRVWGGIPASMEAWGGGPISGDFKLGVYRELLLGGFVSELPGLIFCVLFLTFGCYHLYLYGRNRQLDSYLWFGLVAINIAIYGLMLTQWKYLFDWSFLTMKKLEFGLIYLFPAVAMQMIWSLLRLRTKPWLRAYQGLFVAASVTVVTIPGHTIHYQTLNLWQMSTLPLLVLGPWVILREARAGNQEARTMSVGVMIFVATCVNDLLIDLVHLQTSRLTPYGFVAVMLAMAVSLANRFTSMFGALEREVAERTAELSEANGQLARAARIDHLTGLLNRRGFIEEVEAEIRREFRSGRGFTLVLADVDKFKQFNDDHGHVCGDHVLKRVAAILQERVRDVDRVGRWGGEEFILLLPETDVDGAAVLAEQLREVIADNLFEFGGERLGITMTFGITSYRRGETLDTCIARADTALYHGKECGRNKVMIGNYKGLTLVN